MQVKFLDLSLGFKRIEKRFLSVVQDIGLNASFIGGRYVDCFEEAFANYIGVDGCVGVGNGTDALEIAILALGLPEGSEIIIPSHTFFASLEAVLNAGYRARIVDCGVDYLLDIEALKRSIQADSQNLGAIMPVHLYGQMCDMKEVMALAEKHRIYVVEDASQAHGARMEYKGEIRKAGSIGDVGCFSFYPGKNLGAFGDGGGIVARHSWLLSHARSIANHGIIQERYKHERVGRNSRLDAIQAAALGLKLQNLDFENAKRVEIARLYDVLLRDIEGYILPVRRFEGEFSHIYHIYTLRLEGRLKGKRDELRAYLAQHGIESGVHYPLSLADLPAVRQNQSVKIESSYNACEYARDIISLPMGDHLDAMQVEYVCKHLRQFCT